MFFVVGIILSAVAAVFAKTLLTTPLYCTEGEDCGSALFLTPFINTNRLSEAREASKVPSFFPKEPQITSHSGYITVKKGSNLFFWLFHSVRPSGAPMVLWLGGTPGVASSSSVFLGNGPYKVSRLCECLPFTLHPTAYHWSDILHVLYIDSPVGAGFSFAHNNSGLSTTTSDVVEDLYDALTQIFQLFPEYKTTDFFVIGESFSAKNALALASLISLKNLDAGDKINLKGVAVGNPWLYPAAMLGYSNSLYNIGLIGSKTRDNFRRIEDHIFSLTSNGSYSEALDLLQKYMPINLTGGRSLVENATGFSYFGNYLQSRSDDKHLADVMEFLNQPDIRRQLHVGAQPLTSLNSDVFEKLKLDLLQTDFSDFPTVTEYYRVLLYSSQLDISSPYHLTSNILRNLRSNDYKKFLSAKRRKWYVEGRLAGYVKSSGNLTEVLIRDAGLSVAEDQPLWYWDLVKKFTQRIDF